MKKKIGFIAFPCVAIALLLISISSVIGYTPATFRALFNLTYTAPTRISVTLDSGSSDALFSNDLTTITYNGDNAGGFLFDGLFDSNGEFNFETPIKTGYGVYGWKYKIRATDDWSNSVITNLNAKSTVIPFTDHLYLQAQWTTAYTITLDNQLATISGTSSVSATIGSPMPSITVPTKTGCTFGGYYTGTNGIGTQYYTASGASTKSWNTTSNTTLYAYWIMNPNYFGDTYAYLFPSGGDNTTVYPAGRQITYTWVESLGFYVEGGDTSITSGKRLAIGHYPQSYVGSSLKTTLNTAYSSGTLTATGKSYTTDVNGTYTILNEYTYNGSRYARLASAMEYGGYNYNNGDNLNTGETYWFKVEPIPVTVMSFNSTTNASYKTVMSDIALGSHRYNGSENVVNWNSNPEIRTFLNGSFYSEVLADVSNNVAVEATIYYQTKNNGTLQGTACSVKDRVWVPSYYEMTQEDNGFDTDETRQDPARYRKATDLAKATYAYADTGSSILGNTFYWTRSPNPDSYIYGVHEGGYLSISSSYVETRTFCPCFALDI